MTMLRRLIVSAAMAAMTFVTTPGSAHTTEHAHAELAAPLPSAGLPRPA